MTTNKALAALATVASGNGHTFYASSFLASYFRAMGDKSIHSAHISSLVRDGLLEKEGEHTRNGSTSVRYVITAAGRAALGV